MKSSLRKLKGFAFHKHDHKEKRDARQPSYQDELLQASQDMLDMRKCYDSLLSAAAATTNSAYEFSEALQELGTRLLEKTALNDDEESGKILLMLGKTQFELQKLLDSYRAHVIQTITTPSESLLKELQTVEEMKRQCDEKSDLCKFMIAAQKEKGTSRNSKSENFTSEQLQAAQKDYQEEATLFIFRLKSLKQGQLRSLLTQATRHHAAQLNFFRKGVKSLEVLEPHVKIVAEQQHIDYQFIGLADDDTDGDELDDYDGNDDGEVSFDYGQNGESQDAGFQSRNSMELDQADQTSTSRLTAETTKEILDRSQTDYLYFNREPRAVSLSAPLVADKKLELSERTSQMRPTSTKKYHTYALPTPVDVKNSSLTGSGNTVSASGVENKGVFPTQLWHSSPLQPNMLGKDLRDVLLPSPTGLPKTHSVLKENINSGPIRMPTSLNEGLFISQFAQNASDAKKIKRQAFSGPLTRQTLPNKPILSAAGSISTVEYSSLFSAVPTRIPTSQPNVARKLSPIASPILSPRINELHELPRPPVTSAKPAKPSSMIGYSGPLVHRGREFNATNKLASTSSHAASPLPTPPGAMARSFSIPSSGQRSPNLTVAKLEVPISESMTTDLSSPPLTPISLTNSQPASTSSESVNHATKPKGFS